MASIRCSGSSPIPPTFSRRARQPGLSFEGSAASRSRSRFILRPPSETNVLLVATQVALEGGEVDEVALQLVRFPGPSMSRTGAQTGARCGRRGRRRQDQAVLLESRASLENRSGRFRLARVRIPPPPLHSPIRAMVERETAQRESRNLPAR